ncbi:MAG: iron-sulfur cluster assembly accessory protein [Candidatus Yanofskybacteria bacterium]|nr:iron-sulfur cluster assembly accessory protein [Candidatus Yanofskybacteria bacterium]
MLTITPEATERLRQILETEKENYIRLFVRKVNLSDFQLGVMAGEGQNLNDISLEINGLTLIIDPDSAKHLKDANIDFVDDVVGGGFVFENSSS